MPVIDNFLIRNNTVYFDTGDETSMPLVSISNYTGGFPQWVREKSDFKPYTPSVLDILDALKVLHVQDFVHHRELIRELEALLCQ